MGGEHRLGGGTQTSGLMKAVFLLVMIFVPTQHWRECQALQVLWKAEGAQERHVCQSGVQSSETAQKTKVFICSPQ